MFCVIKYLQSMYVLNNNLLKNVKYVVVHPTVRRAHAPCIRNAVEYVFDLASLIPCEAVEALSIITIVFLVSRKNEPWSFREYDA